MRKLVPEDFNVPERFDCGDFYLRVLTIHDVVKDFEAVIANAKRLTSPNEDNKGWPYNLSLEQNMIDLAWHQKEFQMRSSFTYSVFASDDKTCLGSVYMYPADKGGHDVKIEMWAREDTALGNIDDRLYEKVKGWVCETWPYKKPAFVGTDISREEWEQM